MQEKSCEAHILLKEDTLLLLTGVPVDEESGLCDSLLASLVHPFLYKLQHDVLAKPHDLHTEKNRISSRQTRDALLAIF